MRKVLRAFGLVIVQWIIARVVIMIIAPAPLSSVLGSIADIWALAMLVGSGFVMLIVNNVKVVRVFNVIGTSALALLVVVSIVAPNFSFRRIMPSLPDGPRYNHFIMGEDNYSFPNAAGSFGYRSDYGIPLERFRLIFSESEARTYSQIYGYVPWRGSCYGFSATSSLFDKGTLYIADYQSDIDTAYKFDLPRNNRALLELIELYQISQSLDDTFRANAANTNDLRGLVSSMYNNDGTVKRNGLLVSVRNFGGGHAIIAYDIEAKGNGVYELSIYDNNYPNDSNRVLTADLNNNTWSYPPSYSNSTGSISFIDTSIVYDNVQRAIRRQSRPFSLSDNAGNDMKVIVPLTVETTQNGVPLSEVEGAIDITPIMDSDVPLNPIWYLPTNDNVDFEVTGNTDVTVFDEFVSYMVTVDAASVSGSSATGITLSTNNEFEIAVIYSEDETISFAGTSSEPFSISEENGEFEIIGAGRIKVQQGNRGTTITLKDDEIFVVNESMLKWIIPWYVYVVGGLLLTGGIVFVIWTVRNRRNNGV